MNVINTRVGKARMLAALMCVLGAVAVLTTAPMFVRAAADRPASASEAESLAVLRQNAPAIARAIGADKELRSVVGADKWPLALHRLAEFSKKTDADHKDALRIIGDTVARVKSPVGTIKLDGDPSEWSNSIPPPDFAVPGSAIWDRDSAAVVRQDRLYLMAGLAWAAEDFAMPDNELRVTIDCRGDQAWDVSLSLCWCNGRWMIKQMPLGFEGQEIKTLPPVEGAVGTVAEIGMDIRGFVPLTEAKPIWTLYLQAKGTWETKDKVKKRRAKWATTHVIPVFNENAGEGVAAWPYVRTFLCLCADKPLETFELTAAAIAIMSSATYNDSDEDVRKKIRVDNADFLELARSIDAWQAKTGTEYRLKRYPLEAQLAWAARAQVSGNKNTRESIGERGKKKDAGNYYWESTSVETLEKLRALAITEGLADASLAKCGKLIDRWVRAKQEAAYPLGSLPGSVLGNPQEEQVHEREAREEELNVIAGFGSHHAETILKQIETHGYIIGSCACGQHNQFCQNLLRALGIAPLGFWEVRSREGMGDHASPAWYDPAQDVWLSYQGGTDSKAWYFFFCGRPLVFSYAAEVGRFQMDFRAPRPFPLYFCRELRGFDVKKTAQTGIPTQAVRESMLTPGFGFHGGSS